MLQIALLGAAGTGKKQLAVALRAALSASGRTHVQVTAIDYTEWRGDRAQQVLALAQHRRFDLTLLMGLDLPWQGDASHGRESVDQLLRQMLAQNNVPYKVIYGAGAERLHNALDALGTLLSCNASSTAPVPDCPASNSRWVWACDKCSDPQCERRLLSDLVAGRAEQRLP